MKLKKYSWKYGFLSFVLIVIVICIGTFFNLMTFEKNYDEMIVKSRAIVARETVNIIEYSLKYGKTLDKFYGMQEEMNSLTERLSGLKKINITDTENNILHSNAQQDEISDIRNKIEEAINIDENLSYMNINDDWIIMLKIRNTDGLYIGSLQLYFDKKILKRNYYEYAEQLIEFGTLLALITLFILLVIIYKKNVSSKKMTLLFCISLTIMQIAYVAINYLIFEKAYNETTENNSVYIETYYSDFIEKLQENGVYSSMIDGLDDYLIEIADNLEGVERLHYDEGQVKTTIDQSYIKEKLFEILVDMVTVLVISILFMVEIILLLQSLANKSKDDDLLEDYYVSRGMIFLVNLVICLPVSFIVLFMQELYEPIGNLSRDVMLGLPLSTEMLGGIIAIPICLFITSRIGEKGTMIAGFSLVLIANIFTSFCNKGILFILYRGIVGLGIGFMMMSFRIIVLSMKNRSTALANFVAGSVAGTTCGIVLGGLLADRLGYANVFFIVALGISLLLIIYTRIYSMNIKLNIETRPIKELLVDIFHRSVFKFVVLVFIPLLIISMFLTYVMPLVANFNNLTSSDLSRAFLLNGLCVIYLGPVLTNWFKKKCSDIASILISTIMIITAVISIFIIDGYIGVIISVMLLGIGDGFGYNIQTEYFFNLKSISNLGIYGGVICYSILTSFGKMLGPIIYGMVSTNSMAIGVSSLAFGTLCFVSIFCILEITKEKRLKNEISTH